MDRACRYDADAEAVLLGNCLLLESALPLRGFDLTQFYRQNNKKVAHGIVALSDAGEPVTLRRVAQHLHGEVPADYVSQLLDGLPVHLNLDFYRNRIAECALYRQAAAAAFALNAAYENGDLVEINDGHARLAEIRVRQGIGRYNEARQIELVDSIDFLRRTSTDEGPSLIEGLVPAQSHTMWQGRPKVGKSHSLLQLAFDAAIGAPVFGRFRVPEPVRVCYVELEEPEGETKKRFEAMIRAHGGQGPEEGQLRFFSRDDLFRLRLFSHELLTTHLEPFGTVLKAARVQLLILIALRKLVRPGHSLNDPEVAQYLNAGLSTLRQLAGVAIATGQHVRKNPAGTVEAQGLGSTMLSAEPDGVFDLRRRADGAREVSYEGRYRVDEERFCLELSSENGGEVILYAPWHGENHELKAELRRRVNEKGQSVNQAAEELGIPKTTAYTWMKQ
jgi:hypothetical protein